MTKERNFSQQVGEAARGYGCLISGSTQDQSECGFEQSGVVGGAPLHGRGLELNGL